MANLLNYEFEGNLNDSSGNGLTFSFSPSAVNYSTVSVFPPSVALGATPLTIRAGTATELDASASFSNSDSQVLSYRWQQVDGPQPGTWANGTTKAASFTAPVFG